MTAVTGASRRPGTLAGRTILDVFVPGIPQPQGSARAFVRGTRAVVTSDNPRLRPWRQAVTASAWEAYRGSSPEAGPVYVELRFVFPRPTSHFGKKGLRPSAPAHPAVRPDLDKVTRACLDALTESGAIRDDSLVVELLAVKSYGDEPGVRLVVSTEDPQ